MSVAVLDILAGLDSGNIRLPPAVRGEILPVAGGCGAVLEKSEVKRLVGRARSVRRTSCDIVMHLVIFEVERPRSS